MEHQFKTIVAAGMACSPAGAQLNTFNIVVSNTVSPAHPSATVEVWASFDPAQFAFAQSDFDVYATPDTGDFSDPTTVLFKIGGARNGDVGPGGDSVVDIRAGQFQWIGMQADTANPILLWRSTWSTSDFISRDIDLATSTDDYFLYLSNQGDWHDFVNESFAEGTEVIHIVPAPPILAMVVACGFVAMPRRR